MPDTVADLGHRLRKFAVKTSLRLFTVIGRFLRKTGSLLYAFVRDPRIVSTWYADIKEAVVHFGHWIATGFQHFGANCRASVILTKRVVQGYALTVRERELLVRTTSDCLKLIPFSFFVIVPFAELALPFFLRLFPNMLPSTFFEQKYDNATMARKLQAKTEMAEFWQQVVLQRTKELSEAGTNFADKAEELKEFQEKLKEGKHYPTLAEILRFNKLFREHLALDTMTSDQLNAMSKMLGLPTAKNMPTLQKATLRHHITSLRQKDRDYLWEGVDSLTKEELIEACRQRAIRFHEVTEADMRRDLTRWLELSANHRQISTVLLLWIQSFYLRHPYMEVPNHKELEIKVEVPPQEQKEAKEAFQGIAERQKAHLETAREKLENLRKDLDEILDGKKQESEEAATTASEEPQEGSKVEKVEASVADTLKEESAVDRVFQKEADTLSTDPDKCPSCLRPLQKGEDEEDKVVKESEAALVEVQKHKSEAMAVAQRLREVEKELHVSKEVVQKQKALLDRQLKFLATMRDNKPVQNKDADVILLDQRIRLMEMISSFEKALADIEQVLDEQEPPPQYSSNRVLEPEATVR